MSYYKGINNLELDLPDQVEHNRRGVADNKQSIATLQSQVNQLLSQNPAGFLPQVYYGLTRGDQTYRFTEGHEVTVNAEGNLNDSYEFIADNETENYISAVGVKTADNKVTVVIQGDYNIQETNFTLVNTRTGSTVQVTLVDVLSLQDASYLGEFQAQDNKEKQITVLKDLQSGQNNAIYASIDRNGDGVFNWTRIGGYVNGTNGTSIYAATETTMSTVLSNAKTNDIILIGETFTYNDVEYAVGNLYKINSLDPLSLELRGNIRGPQGATGSTGASGQDGSDGNTPYIQDGYWYIDGVNTNVRAIGQNGQDGQDGQSFNVQSGLYSTPANYGQTGNVDSQGNPLLQLPTLPQNNISGHGYVVYDPLTTPLDPFYDLYYANNGDNDWTIIHPFSGIAGQNGVDGYTPYIQGGYWYINGVNTGVEATGPQGEIGPTGAEGLSIYTSSANILDNTGSVLVSTVTVPTGRTIKIGDLILGANNGMARISAISGDNLTLTINYVRNFTYIPTNTMTTDTDQTITGTKTFSSNPVVSGLVKSGTSYTLSLPTLTANRTIATTNQIPTVDSSLSTTSTNPVRNSVVTNAINDKMSGSVSLLYGGNPNASSVHTVTSINNYKFILLNTKLGSYWVSNIFSVSMITNEITAYGNCEISVEDNNKDNWKYCRIKFTSATSFTVTAKDSIDWLYVYGVN